MQRVAITLMRYHTRYRTFSLRFAWFWAICNGLPRVTVKFINKYIYTTFLEKLTITRGNPLQIAQNQENLRKNIW